MKTTLIALLALMAGCAGAADGSDPDSDSVADAAADSGAAPTEKDAGCGLSFDDARDAFAPERVCQTTEYDQVTGYCTHWVACSSLY